MADPLMIAAIASMGLGQLGQLFGGTKGQKSYRKGVQSRVDIFRDQLAYDDPYEALLKQFGAGLTEGSLGESFNTGQDALSQFLRSDPTRQTDYVDTALEDIVGGGAPFDLSNLYAALEPLETRAQGRALSALRGSAPTLGRRFGSAAAGKEADMLAQITEAGNARRGELAFQAHEGAQGRRLAGAQLATGRRDSARQALLQAIGLGNDAGGVNMQRQALALQALMGGANIRGNRQGLSAQLLSLLSGGTMIPGETDIAGPMGDIGGMLMLLGLRNKKGGK